MKNGSLKEPLKKNCSESEVLVLRGTPRYKICVVKLHRDSMGEKSLILGRKLTAMVFDLIVPTNWMCEPGQTIQSPMPYFSNKMIGQDVSSFPVLKVIIYNDSLS